MSGVNIPTDSTHLSDQARSEMIEQYGGAVDSQITKSSIMKRIFDVMPIKGTDTKIVRRVGRTQLNSITPGVRPAASKTNFGRTSVTVDTVIIARDNRSLLNEFQIDFNARAELGRDHGKEMAKFFDEAFLIQGVKSAAMAAPSGLNGAIGAGKVETLAAAGNELDPDLLYKKIETVLVRMQEEDIDTEEMIVFVRPTQYNVLVNNSKLIDRDFSSDNGSFNLGKIKSLMGSAIVPTARIPTAAITGHRLSNAENGFAYDTSATDAKAVAVILHPQALLAGETIPITSNVFFSDIEKQWFIDTWMAFGVSNRRPDLAGVVRKF